MSKVEMHAPFTTFSGTIGKLVYRKVRGRTIVAVKPDPDRPLSQAEVAHRQDFAQAATWAKAALQDEELRPFYEALGKQRDIPARAAAVSDFLKPTLARGAGPVGVCRPGRGPASISWQAITAAWSTRQSRSRDGNGTVFESGAAVEVETGTGYWMYTAHSTLPASVTVAVINVKVSDRPGNTVEATDEKAL